MEGGGAAEDRAWSGVGQELAHSGQRELPECIKE